jgi:hypothetical protein
MEKEFKNICDENVAELFQQHDWYKDDEFHNELAINLNDGINQVMDVLMEHILNFNCEFKDSMQQSYIKYATVLGTFDVQLCGTHIQWNDFVYNVPMYHMERYKMIMRELEKGRITFNAKDDEGI